MTIEEIIERIAVVRNKSNLSARELSLRIGKNAAYLNRLEYKKDFEPSLSTLLDILTVCGVTEEEFFYHDMNEYKVDMETLAFLKTLSKSQKQAIMNLYK